MPLTCQSSYRHRLLQQWFLRWSPVQRGRLKPIYNETNIIRPCDRRAPVESREQTEPILPSSKAKLRATTIAFGAEKTAKRHLFRREFGCVEPFTDGIYVGITPMFKRHFKKFWEGVEKAWKHRSSTKQEIKHYFRSTCVSLHLKSADLLDSRYCACQWERGSTVSRTETRSQLNSSFSLSEL